MNPNSGAPPVSPALVLTGGVLAVSTSAILVRMAQNSAPSLVISTWRLLLAALILLPWSVTRGRRELEQLTPAGWRLALLSGMLLAVHFATWISSLAFTSVASSTVLATSTPIWVALAAPLLLGESISRAVRAGIAVAVGGGLLIALDDIVVWSNGIPALLWQNGADQPMIGNLLALTAAITAAGYVIIGRRLRERLSLLSYIAVVYSTAAATLVGVTIVAGLPFFGYDAVVYLLCLLMAIFPQLLGHSSYNYALGYMPATFVTVAIISEPVGASVLAVLVLREWPGPLVVAGGGLLLLGIFLSARPVRPVQTAG